MRSLIKNKRGVAFKEYPIYFLLVGLFIVVMISFGSQVAKNYGHDETLVKDENFDFSGIEQKVRQTSEDADSWGKIIRSDNPLLALGGLVLFSIWGVANLIWGSVMGMFILVSDGATSILGIPTIVTGVITAILIISLIFALYRLIRGGE